MADHAFHISMQLELFPWSEVNQWLPDEVLFSLASRHHAQAGHGRASDTCERLFGHPQRGSAHDLPSRIDELVRRTRGELGPAQAIIQDHTILPFYLPFRGRDTADAAVAAMRGDGIGSLKYRLGLLTSRFRAHHPLKACARCLIEDRTRFRIAYWHLTHQYPGVWICPDHEVELLESLVKSTGVGRFLWHLPHESMLVAANRGHYAGRPPDDQRDRLLRLARAAIALARLPAGFFFDPGSLLQTYRAGLADKGLCSTSGRLDLRNIGTQFLAFATPYRTVPEFAALPITAARARAQLGRLFYPPRAGAHPLRHLLLILWLFDTWESFWEAYARFDDAAPKTLDLFRDQRLASRMQGAEDLRVPRFLDLIRLQARSVTSASHAVGIDPATGMAWAARAGIPTRRRAKLLKPEVLTSLVCDLRRGMDKNTVATSHHVSLASINRVLRTEAGLHEAWRDARLERARLISRREWRSAIEQSAVRGPKAARTLVPAAYAWLYRNDRAWLREQIRNHPRPVRTNHAAIDWDDRDQRFAASIGRVCQDLARTAPTTRVSIHQVCRHLPHLAPKLGRLNRLPRTRHALERGIGKTPSGRYGRKPR